MENRMFDQMRKAAISWLSGRNPLEIAKNANIGYDNGVFYFESLGKNIKVTYPDYTVTPQLPEWHELIILHYLHLADGTPLSGKTIAFSQYRSGMIRGGDFDRRAEMIFRSIDMESLEYRCRKMGGKKMPSRADFCAQIPFLPMYPVTVAYWQADEDFSASGRLMPDASAEHYLTIEDAVTVGELILEIIKDGVT